MTCKALLIGELKARRQALGWSLADVGERSGLDECALGSWERGETWPRLDLVEAWAAVLGLKLVVVNAADSPRRGLQVDWDNHRVSVDGTAVRLTPMEWKALERLAKVPGELVTHQALFRHLYGDDRPYCAHSTAIRVLITKLRRLLPLRIDAQWGRGYVLGDIAPSSPLNGQHEHDVRPAAKAAPPNDPLPIGHTRDRVLSTPARPNRLLDDFSERGGSLMHRPAATAPTRFLSPRAEELDVIERFLSERGATRCPDVATIERDPLPTLVWDKIKRKWVRPTAEAASR